MISETARNGGVRETVKRRIGCRNLLSRVTVGVDAVSQSQASTPKCQKEHGGGRSGALGSPQELLHSHFPLAPPVETVVFIMLLAAANARQRLNNLQLPTTNSGSKTRVVSYYFAWRLKAEHTSVRVLRVCRLRADLFAMNRTLSQ